MKKLGNFEISALINERIMASLMVAESTLRMMPVCPQCGEPPVVMAKHVIHTLQIMADIKSRTVCGWNVGNEGYFLWCVSCSPENNCKILKSGGDYITINKACDEWLKAVELYYYDSLVHQTAGGIHRNAMQFNERKNADENIIIRKNPYWFNKSYKNNWKIRPLIANEQPEQNTRIILLNEQ